MTTYSLPPSSPCVALGAAGTLAIAIAWLGAADELRVGDQAEWTLIGIVGTAAVALAALLWVLAARRAVEHRLATVLGGVDSALAPAAARDAEWQAAEVLVASTAMAHYHRAACPLAAGKPVRTTARDAHEAAGRQPCGVCGP